MTKSNTSTGIIPIEKAKTDLVGGVDIDKKIKELKKEHGGLKLLGPTDKDMYNTIKDVHNKIIVPLRTSVDKKRKELKRPAIEYGKAIEEEAKRIISMIKTIEDPLIEQRKIYEDHEEKLRIEKENARRKKIEDRKVKIQSLHPKITLEGMVLGDAFITLVEIEHMTDSDFTVRFELFKDEREKIDTMEAEKNAEAERIRKQNEELQEKIKALEAKQNEEQKPEPEEPETPPSNSTTGGVDLFDEEPQEPVSNEPDEQAPPPDMNADAILTDALKGKGKISGIESFDIGEFLHEGTGKTVSARVVIIHGSKNLNKNLTFSRK